MSSVKWQQIQFSWHRERCPPRINYWAAIIYYIQKQSSVSLLSVVRSCKWKTQWIIHENIILIKSRPSETPQSVSHRPFLSLQGEPVWYFITQIKTVKRLCISWRRLIQLAHKCPGFCHPFVHVWSHISHLSLLGSYNLPEAFSRNPADSVIWNALWLFIIEFTHMWEDL